MKKSVSQLKKKADVLFSRQIRQKAANHRGYAKCYTCGVTKKIAELQAGHYYSRSINQLRYDERNVKPQCQGCNIWKEGNKPKFALALIKEYGQKILEELAKEAQKTKQFTVKELEELIKKYKNGN